MEGGGGGGYRPVGEMPRSAENEMLVLEQFSGRPRNSHEERRAGCQDAMYAYDRSASCCQAGNPTH